MTPEAAETRTIRVLPLDAFLFVLPNESLFDSAMRAGWRWPSTCGGIGECGTCYMVVEEGAPNLNAVDEPERACLDAGLHSSDSRTRLACKTKIHNGQATVTRRGARPRR